MKIIVGMLFCVASALAQCQFPDQLISTQGLGCYLLIRPRARMLLLDTNQTFQQVQDQTFRPFVVIPASRVGESRKASKTRANDLVVSGRVEGRGMKVLESSNGDLFALVAGNIPQCVGFARQQATAGKTAEDWFLLADDSETLVQETAAKCRIACQIDSAGFALPDGRRFEIVAAYGPAPRNIGMLASRGQAIPGAF